MTFRRSSGLISLSPTPRKRDEGKRAYTFLEISVVFLVLSVLIVGGITVTRSMSNDAKKQLTEQRLKAVYDAYGKFVDRKSVV